MGSRSVPEKSNSHGKRCELVRLPCIEPESEACTCGSRIPRINPQKAGSGPDTGRIRARLLVVGAFATLAVHPVSACLA